MLPFRHLGNRLHGTYDAESGRETPNVERREPAHCPGRRSWSSTWCARASDRGRDPGPRQLGADRRPARSAGRDPDGAGHARAVGRPPRRRLLPRDRPADPGLHQHRPGGDQHGRRDGDGLRRLDRRGAAHRLAPHVHARRRPAPGARAPPCRRQPADLRAGRQGVVAAVAGRRAAVRPAPGLEPDALRPARADPARPADGRPGRHRRGRPARSRAARGTRPGPAGRRRRRTRGGPASLGASGRSSSPAAARSWPRRRPRSRPSPSGSARRS